MEESKRKSSGEKILRAVLVSVILIIIVFLAMWGLQKIKIVKSNTNVKTAQTMSEFKGAIGSMYEIPSFIVEADSADNIYKYISGISMEIDNPDYVLKACQYADIEGDPLGLYEKPESDEFFTVDNGNGIEFIRIRRGYPKFEKCTIANYKLGDIMYGILLSGLISNEDICKYLDAPEAKLTKMDYTVSAYYDANSDEELTDDEDETEHEDSDSNAAEQSGDTKSKEIEYKFIPVGANGGIHIPLISSDITVSEIGGASVLYMDSKPLLVAIYDSNAFENNSFTDCTVDKINEDLSLAYSSGKEFSGDSKTDYETIMKDLDYIKYSFKYFMLKGATPSAKEGIKLDGYI